MNLATGSEVEKGKYMITREECTLFQKKIFEHDQTTLENNALQLKLDLAKKEHVSFLGKHSTSEAKIKTVHDPHLKSIGEVTKWIASRRKIWSVCMSNQI